MEGSKEEKGEKKRETEKKGGKTHHTEQSRGSGMSWPKVWPHRLPASLPTGSRPSGAWAGSLEAVPSHSSFLSSQD